MERHFILPVTVAVALHAGLLLGFRRGPVPGVINTVIQMVKTDPMFIPPPEDPPPVYDAAESARKGPQDPPPTGIDESIPSHDPIAIEIARQPVAIPGPDRPSIPLELPGMPGGTGYGNRPGTGDILNLSQLDGVPRTRAQIAPIYPARARSQGMKGEVVVEFTVDERGGVLDPHVVRSSDPVFEEASLRAVAKWRFEPGLKQGRPVSFRMVVPLVFNLND